MLGTSLETTYMEIPNTCVKTVHKGPTQKAPRIIQGTKEASEEEVLASLNNFLLLLIEEILISPMEVN